jgi:hypothetical protein
MSDLRTKRRDRRNWRAYLTPEESKRLGQIDRELAKMQKAAGPLKYERHTIQNRASVRAGQAERDRGRVP